MEDRWQKFTVITNALGLIAIPIVIAFASYLFSQTIESKKSEEKFITIAVDILKTLPEKTQDNKVSTGTKVFPC